MNPSTSIQLLVFILISLSSCHGRVNKSYINVTFHGSRSPVKVNLDEAISYGIKQMDMLYRIEESLENAQISVKIKSPSHGQLMDSFPSMKTRTESRYAEIVVKATSYIADKYYLSQGRNSLMEFTRALKNVKLNPTRMGDMCYSNYYKGNICRTTGLKYQSFDGSCNNLRYPYWGKSTTPYRRNIYPAYKDGISDMNDMLPNPRELSNSLVDDSDTNNTSKTFYNMERTMAVGIWALFIGQDMSHIVVSSSGATNNKVIQCCNENGSPLPPRHMHPLCAPIIIPKNDPFFQPLGRTCMNYVRSAIVLPKNCTFGYRDQVNQATHYLDGSMIYGTSYNEMMLLRKHSQGLMLTVTLYPDINSLLPLSDLTTCQTINKCFKSGDDRVNSHPHLLALYTAWVLEHNRIAGELALINQHWDDDQLFHETRRIIIAMIQHITFNEWLPAVFGDSNVNQALFPYFNLMGSRDNYNSTVDPSTSDAFANIIVPMAYSMLSGSIALTSNNTRIPTTYLPIKDIFNRPYENIVLGFNELLRGFVLQKSESVDMSFSKNFTDHLYEENGFGMDIVSLSIQRGRDHGIPGYTAFAKPCGLRPIRNEKDLALYINETIASKLMKIYKNIDDIDFIVGALSEKPVANSMIGPTLMCIIKDQLVRSRIGDRYFYDLPSVFTGDQLAEIKTVTMARLLCTTGNNIERVPLNSFRRKESPSEVRWVNCESDLIPEMDLQVWSEDDQSISKLKN